MPDPVYFRQKHRWKAFCFFQEEDDVNINNMVGKPVCASDRDFDSWIYPYTGWGKGRFIVVNVQNTEFILLLLFIYYCTISIQTTVNLLLPHPLFNKQY